MSEMIVKDLDGTKCPECGKVCKTLSGLSKHMNSAVHTIVKKDISQIVAEEIPGIRCTFFKDGNDKLICHYDAYASEEVVQQMVDLMKKLNIDCSFERMPF